MNRAHLTAALLTVAVLAGTAPSAPAADAEGNYAVFGAGRISCNAFLKDREQGALDRYKPYVLGYLSAWNALAPETYSISGDRSLDDILALVASGCGDRRIEGFERVLHGVVGGFAESRVRAVPKPGRGWGR